MLFWWAVSFLLVVTFPFVIRYGMTISAFVSFVVGGITYWIGDKFYRVFSSVFRLNNPLKIERGLEYNIVKKERVFHIRDEKGIIRHPSEDEVVQMYFERNTNYPEVDTPSFKHAKNLNMSYFIGKDYPYDYIVLGDRAQIEEARKGELLTEREEALVFLGYGYDERPFGEPWGLEEEFLNDYLYAIEQGDLLDWRDETDNYKAYIGAGYEPPKDYYSGVNIDLAYNARSITTDYGEFVFQLNREVFRRLKRQDKQDENKIVTL